MTHSHNLPIQEVTCPKCILALKKKKTTQEIFESPVRPIITGFPHKPFIKINKFASVHTLASPCKNLLIRQPNVKFSDDSSKVSCVRCILVLNKKVVTQMLNESSKYQHSGKVGVDMTRKLPEFAILGFRSYTTPQYAIRDAHKSNNPSLYFSKSEFTILVTTRNLSPSFDNTSLLRAFKDMFLFVIDQIEAHCDLGLTFSVTDTALTYRNEEVNVLSVETNLGYIIQYILMIHVGKMANILDKNPEVDKFRLMEQIFSNQSNPKQANYRSFMRILLNGELNELWDTPEAYRELSPQINGFDMYETRLPPSWMTVHLGYKKEIDLIEKGLYF